MIFLDHTCTVKRMIPTGEETQSGHSGVKESTVYGSLRCSRPTQKVMHSNDGVIQVSDTDFIIRVPRLADVSIGDTIVDLQNRQNEIFFHSARVLNIIKNRTHLEVTLERR